MAVDEIETRLQRLTSSSGPNDAVHDQLVEIYNNALAQARRRDEWLSKGTAFEKERLEIPDRISAIQNELVTPQEQPDLSVERTLSIADLEARITELEHELDEAQQDVASIESERASRIQRRRQVAEMQSSLRERLRQLTEDSAKKSVSGNIPEVAEASRLLEQVNRAAMEAELDAYDKEVQCYEPMGRLLDIRLDLAVRQRDRVGKLTNTVGDLLRTKKRDNAVLAVEQARDALSQARHAPLQIRNLVEDIAAENVALASQRLEPSGLLEKNTQIEAKLKQMEARVATLRGDLLNVKVRVVAGAGNRVSGTLLLTHRNKLPGLAQLRRNVRNRQNEIAEIQIQQLEAADERRGLGDIESLVQNKVAELAPDAGNEQHEHPAEVLRRLYTSKRNELDSRLEDLRLYFEKLVDLNARENELIAVVEEFNDYIDEHLLWVPSAATIRGSDFANAAGGLLHLGEIRKIPGVLLQDSRRHPLMNFALFVGSLLMIAARRRLRRDITALGRAARRWDCTSMSPTLITLGLTFLRSAAFPFLCYWLGWRLSLAVTSTEAVRAMGMAFMLSGLIWLGISFPRQVFCDEGLAIAHFGWPAEPLNQVRREFLWLMFCALPLTFIVVFFHHYGDLAWQESIGRFAFIAYMLCLAISGHRLLRRRGGAIREALRAARQRGATASASHVLAVSVPILLLLFACFGYYYSALALAQLLIRTLSLVFALTLFMGFARRWILLARRALIIEQIEARGQESAQVEPGSNRPQELEVDLAQLDAQTVRLLRGFFILSLIVGVHFVWAGILPALSALDNVKLWDSGAVVQPEVVDDEGVVVQEAAIHYSTVTLRHLVVALAIAVITFLIVQNLPGIVEIVLLRKFPLTEGERYAIRTLFAYLLTVIGVVCVFSTLGIGWSRLQWLVAAMGLGLGFGLQEIFANFVSGLIILFERPVRVGDTVTVGDISGTVTRLRIRATWITAFDRRELVVPNKEFVTSRLINWTLSDQVLRLDVPVGVAYGSDTMLTRETLLRVARENPGILNDPAPRVFFLGFGESSLNFELRVYCPDIASRLILQDELHMAIDGAFRAAGIVIAFPQRDVHIRYTNESGQIKPDLENQESEKV